MTEYHLFETISKENVHIPNKHFQKPNLLYSERKDSGFQYVDYAFSMGFLWIECDCCTDGRKNTHITELLVKFKPV